MTTNSSQNPAPAPNSGGSDNSKQRLIAIAAVIIVLLLGVNAFLLFNKFKQDRLNTELNTELDETEQLRAELEQQYYAALSELEEKKGQNEELNALIESQKEELRTQKEDIDRLLRSKRDLDEARRKIRDLSAQVEQYLAEINQLRQENEELLANNEELSEVNQDLRTNLDSQYVANQQLSSAKAALVSEKEQLEASRSRLSKKVNMASVIKVSELEGNGVKIKSSGKEVTRRSAKNVDLLEVCFNTTVNEIAEPGTEVFHVRIINPSGETLALDSKGSGVLVNRATSQEVRYTKVKEVDYNRDQATYCLQWEPDQPLQEGDYTVEVYNKGHLAGANTFKLR